MAVLLLVGCLLLSYAPCLLLYFWLKRDMVDQERQALCRKLLLGGVLCALGVIACSATFTIVGKLLSFTVLPILNTSDLVWTIYNIFLVITFSEELVKGLTAWTILKRNAKSFSWLDVMIAMAIVGIGFEVIESAVYLLESNPIQIIIRGLTAMHAIYGMTMGYFLGKSLHTGKKVNYALAIVLPILLHGLYDFSLSDVAQGLGDFFIFLPFIMIFVTLGIGIRLILLMRKARQQQDEEFLAPLPVD